MIAWLCEARPDGLKVPSEHLKVRLICNAAAGLQSFIATELRDVFGAVILPSHRMAEYVVHQSTLKYTSTLHNLLTLALDACPLLPL